MATRCRLAELTLNVGLGLSSSVALGYASDATLDVFEQADTIGATLPTSMDWAAAYWGLFTFFLVRGELDRAEEQLVRAGCMAEELASAELAHTTTATFGYVRFFQGASTKPSSTSRTACSRRPCSSRTTLAW